MNMQPQKTPCTMPGIPVFHDWFNRVFEDLCRQHDADYYKGECKLCADWRFVFEIAKRGYWYLSIPVFLAINMPWVWVWWYTNDRDDYN